MKTTLYDLTTRGIIFVVQDHFYIEGRGLNITIGDVNLKNYYFTQKQQTAFLIYPLIKALTSHLQSRSLSFIEDHALPIDDTIALAVLESDLNTETYSAGVLEYAATLDITPLQAYNELKLDYETTHSIKMRVYALTT